MAWRREVKARSAAADIISEQSSFFAAMGVTMRFRLFRRAQPSLTDAPVSTSSLNAPQDEAALAVRLAAMKEHIRAALVESQMWMNNMDAQVKAIRGQLKAGQEQINRLSLWLAGLGAMEQALAGPSKTPTAIAAAREAASDESIGCRPPAQPAPAEPVESEHSTAPRQEPVLAGAGRGKNDDRDLPPLIEFDPRRAALARRIAASRMPRRSG
jgi:hypothetical protein